MATILAQDYSDESARVFAHMALYLDSEFTDAKLLLARLAARNKREAKAIASYLSITQEEGDEVYIQAQRLAASLLEEQGKMDEAIKVLDTLYKTHADILSLIQIGDIYRDAEEFPKAIKIYNKAAKTHSSPVFPPITGIYYMYAAWLMNKWESGTRLKKTYERPWLFNLIILSF